MPSYRIKADARVAMRYEVHADTPEQALEAIKAGHAAGCWTWDVDPGGDPHLCVAEVGEPYRIIDLIADVSWVLPDDLDDEAEICALCSRLPPPLRCREHSK